VTRITSWIDRRFYAGYERNWDDKLFREKILAHIKPDATVLDVGAGAGIVAEMNFLGSAAFMCGIDLDPRVQANPMLNEGRIADAGHIPYADDTFDLVFADNVMEHIADPDKVFREIYRVLKPAGILMFKTPNVAHYMPTVARLTPHGFHKFINRLRGRASEDTFPTLYRANSASRIRRLATQTGFAVEQISRIEGRPEYLRFMPLTYVLGALYERIVNASSFFEPFRILLICELRKADSGPI